MQKIASVLNRYCGLPGICWLAGISAIILICYQPAWQTNDDPIFDMLINGYGLASRPADPILNCNYLWAALVRAVPNFLGFSSYTLILYTLSILAVIAIWINMARCLSDRTILILLLTSMLFYNLLHPQYTVTAFYCAIAAIAGLMNRIRTGSGAGIVAALVFGIAAFIIREMAFLMIGFLSVFIIPWRKVFGDKILCAFMFLALFLMTLIFLFDYLHKNSFSSWDTINTWQNTRQHLADSDIANAYKKENGLLETFNLSQNDMEMLRTHFSLAPDLRDTERLDGLQKASSFWLYMQNKFVNAEKALAYIFSYPICLLLGVCVLLFLQRYSGANLLTFILLFIVFFMIGFLNRGGEGIDRIYYAPLYLFALLLLLQPPNCRLCSHIWIAPALCRTLVAGLIIFSILAFSKMNLVGQWRYEKYDVQKTGELLNGAVWAGYPFLIEKIYYPFRKLPEIRDIKFQGGGWSALLPDSVSYYDVFRQDSFRNFLTTGFRYASSQKQTEELGVYCREHLGGEWSAELISPPECFPIYKVKCAIPAAK